MKRLKIVLIFVVLIFRVVYGYGEECLKDEKSGNFEKCSLQQNAKDENKFSSSFRTGINAT